MEALVKKYYTGVLRNYNKKTSKKVVYFKNDTFIFSNGVCNNLTEDVAKLFLKRKLLSRITENESGYVFDDSNIEPVVVAVEEIQEVIDTVQEEPALIQEEPVEEVAPSDVEEEIPYTKEQIEDLYGNLGTWAAVAEYLDISTTLLKKYRVSLGL